MENAWIVAAFATLGCVDDRVCLLACQAFLPSLAQTYFEDFFFFPVSSWLLFVPKAHTDGSIQQIRKWCKLHFVSCMVGIPVLQGQL